MRYKEERGCCLHVCHSHVFCQELAYVLSCMQIATQGRRRPAGPILVVLMGDPLQLPGVGRAPCFFPPTATSCMASGTTVVPLWTALSSTDGGIRDVMLVHQFRQQEAEEAKTLALYAIGHPEAYQRVVNLLQQCQLENFGETLAADESKGPLLPFAHPLSAGANAARDYI